MSIVVKKLKNEDFKNNNIISKKITKMGCSCCADKTPKYQEIYDSFSQLCK